MGLFGGKKLNRKVQNVTSFGNEPAEKFLIAIQKEVENEALKLSAVYSAISTISNTMSKIPFSVINRFTKEEIKEANLYNILNLQPTPTMNASDFYKMLASWTLYEGEAFYVPIRKFRSTQIEKLVPVRKSQVTKDIDENLYMNTIRAKELTLTRTSAGAAHIDGTPTTMPDKLHIQIVEDGLKVLVKKRY